MRLTNTQLALANGLEALVIAMREQLEITGANATGSTSRSLTSQITAVRANSIRGGVFGKRTWFFTDQGRGPGGIPPISAIERWVNAKLGISGSEARGLAFAIARKIGREGTNKPASQFASTAIRLQTPQLRMRVARGLREDVRIALRSAK